jgi:hypothetical protein
MKKTIMFIFYFLFLLYYRLYISFVITREQYHNDIQQLRHKTSGKLQIFYTTKKHRENQSRQKIFLKFN